MRTITIDFTSQTIVSSYKLGKIGEHNATKLVVTPPTELSGDARTASYRLAFASGGKTYTSESYTTVPFEVSVWQQLTKYPRLSIQVVAYDASDAFIGKSSKLGNFELEGSVSGTAMTTDTESDSVMAEIKSNSDARHTHANKSYLDGIESTINGKQATLVSGTNIKTINGSSVLGSGNIQINAEAEIARVNLSSTLSEVETAYAAGKTLIFVDDHMSGTANHFMPLHYATSSWFVFGCTASLDNNNVYRTLNRSTGVWAEEVSVEMATKSSLDSHTNNSGIHVTNSNKNTWNAKVSEAPQDDKQYARKNGAWTEVQGGGGSSKFVTEITTDATLLPDTVLTASSSKTYAELKAAYDNGDMCFAKFYFWELVCTFATTTAMTFEGAFEFEQGQTTLPEGKYMVGIIVASNGACQIWFNTIKESTVASVNGETGNVVLDADDIDYSSDVSVKDKLDAKYEKPSGGIPASDIASGVIPTVPSNVSAFTNDSGYLTQHQDITGKQNVSISPISGMSANTVEGALSELNSDIVTLSNANNIDTTDEKVVGNYIYMDGATKKIRPIYQKVLRGTTTASGSAFTVPLGVQNLGLILSIGGSITHSTEVMFIGGWLSNQDYDAKICYYNVSSGNFDCYCGSGLAGDKEYNFIVRFTKSSDTPTVIEQ